MKTILFTILFVFSITAFAGMRCQGQLINEGDSIVKLLKYCGTPTIRSKDKYFYLRDNGFVYKIRVYDAEIRKMEVTRFANDF